MFIFLYLSFLFFITLCNTISIHRYFNFNDVCRFKYSRPFHKGEKDKTNEFKTLWLERTTYTTNIKFPGLLKSFPVIGTEIKDISPIEYAQETVKLATQELKYLINSLKSGFNILIIINFIFL